MTIKLSGKNSVMRVLPSMAVRLSHCSIHHSLLDSQVEDRTVLIGQGTDMMPTISSAINSHGSSQGRKIYSTWHCIMHGMIQQCRYV